MLSTPNGIVHKTRKNMPPTPKKKKKKFVVANKVFYIFSVTNRKLKLSTPKQK